MKKSIGSDRLQIISLLFVNFIFVFFSYAGARDLLAKENGILENLHLLMLLLAAVTFAYSALCTQLELKSAAVSLSAVCLLGFIREMDIRTIGAPEWILDIFTGSGRHIIFAGIVIPLIVYLFLHRKHFLGWIKLSLRYDAWPLHASVVFIAAGVIMDDFIVHTMEQRFFEELFEFDGYTFLFVTALRHRGQGPRGFHLSDK